MRIFADCVFQRIIPFHLGYQICGHRVVHSVYSFFHMFIGSVVMSIFISIICIFVKILKIRFKKQKSAICILPPPLVSLSRDLSILLNFFQRISLWFYYFFLLILFLISLISALIYYYFSSLCT